MRKTESGKIRALAAAVMILVLALCSCEGGSAPAEEAPDLKEPAGVILNSEEIIKSDLVTYVSYLGKIGPEVYELSFEYDGVIDEIYTYSGAYVEKGDKLVSLDQEAVKKQMASIEESIKDVRKNGEYEDEIADLNIQYLQIELQQIAGSAGTDSSAWRLKSLEIEEAELDKKQAIEKREQQLQELSQRYAVLEEQEDAQVLYAPVSGHVWIPDTLTHGSYAGALRTVVWLMDPNDLYFEITDSMVLDTVLENEVLKADIMGESWELEYMPLDQEERAGYLMSRQIPPTRFRFKDPEAAEKLEAGSFGTLVGESMHLTDVLVVPNTALYKESTQVYVYVLENGSRVRRNIETGRTNGIYTQVTEGLEEGEQVYVQE